MASFHYLRRKARQLAARVFPGVLDAQLRLIRDSGYFDLSGTRRTIGCGRAGVDPLRHYLLYGGWEGRSPGPKFDSLGYLERQPGCARRRNSSPGALPGARRAEGRSPYGAAREAELKAHMRAIQEHYTACSDSR